MKINNLYNIIFTGVSFTVDANICVNLLFCYCLYNNDLAASVVKLAY